MDAIAKFIGYAVIVLIAIGLLAKLKEDGKAVLPANSCKVHTVDIASESFLINEEIDAGYNVTTVVENKGAQAQRQIVAKLTSSEGDFVRKQTVPFKAGESKSLTYQFHEPTITATNINAIVSCE